ncbi:hypothetical protein GCM10008940_23520 [Microbulbifer agarilyticus]
MGRAVPLIFHRNVDRSLAIKVTYDDNSYTVVGSTQIRVPGERLNNVQEVVCGQIAFYGLKVIRNRGGV